MKEKLQQLPVGVVIAAAAGLVGLAGFFIYRTIQAQDGSYTYPMDRKRYMAEMQKSGSQYSTNGGMNRNPRMGGGGYGRGGGYGGGGYGGGGR